MANSRVVTSGAVITGVVRTAVVAAANTVTGGAAGAVDAAATGVGKALTPFWEKVQKETEAANTARNNQMVSTATQPPPAQPNQNSMASMLASIGPMLGSALSNIGSLFKSGGSGNGAPQISPNPRDIAQNTPRDPKDPKDPKGTTTPPKEPSNPKDPVTPTDPKPQNSSTEQPSGGILYTQTPMFNPDNIIS